MVIGGQGCQDAWWEQGGEEPWPQTALSEDRGGQQGRRGTAGSQSKGMQGIGVDRDPLPIC